MGGDGRSVRRVDDRNVVSEGFASFQIMIRKQEVDLCVCLRGCACVRVVSNERVG